MISTSMFQFIITFDRLWMVKVLNVSVYFLINSLDLLYGCFGMLCREKANLIDIKALVAFLETSEDDVCVKDVLYMILGLLTQKSFVSSFIEHLHALGGVTILLNLIRRSVFDARNSTDYLGCPVYSCLLMLIYYIMI